MKLKDELMNALLQEIELRKDFLPNDHLESIYFGGGTPSLLNREELERTFSVISKYFSWDNHSEITIETNPDDLTETYLSDLRNTPINRLSIGIQSFFEEDLKFMNRAHNAAQAERCIPLAQDKGFENITADLIYGSPTTSDYQLKSNLDKMIRFEVPHISAYCLTVEEGTALSHFVKKNLVPNVDERKAMNQFDIVIETLVDNGFTQYEISNFARENFRAIHNSNYWKGKPYLGIGPGAHSFDGNNIRSWNISHNPKYFKGIQGGNLPLEEEHLTIEDLYNEYVLTSLRTVWGISDLKIEKDYPEYYNQFKESIRPFIDSNHIQKSDDIYTLTTEGKHIADKISMELFTLKND